MLLKNYYIFLTNSLTNLSANLSFKKEDSGTRSPSMDPFNKIQFYQIGVKTSSPNVDSYICLGTGTTAVTYEDYCLANKNTNISISNYALSMSVSNGKALVAITCTATNNSGSSITINEIGYGRHYLSGYSGTETLLYREVLDTPIVFAANESKLISLSFEME